MSYFSKNKEYWKRYFKTKKSPEEFIETQIRLKNKEISQDRELFREFYSYLRDERQKKEELLRQALFEQSSSWTDNLCRIVQFRFSQDPLCTYGSLKKSGRFNCGKHQDIVTPFPALYLASDHETAMEEKFPSNFQTARGLLSDKELSLDVRNHSFFNVKVSFQKTLDLRKRNSLKGFFSIILKFKIPTHIKNRITRTNSKRKPSNKVKLSVIKEFEVFLATVFDPLHKEIEVYLQHPSNPQWLGHYCQLAGIEAIIYPSIRSCGHNLAVFPEALEPESFVEILCENESLKRYQMNHDNGSFFRHSLEDLEHASKSIKH